MASVLEQQILTETELARINEIMDFVTQNDYIPTAEAMKEFVVKDFTENSVKILKSEGTPYYILLNSVAKFSQIILGGIKGSVSKMLYTQASGDDLSMDAANYGHARIEAKSSSLILILTASKKITIDANTSFTDGNGNVWLTTKSVDLEENIPTRVSALSSVKGIINFISPMNATNTISGLTTIQVDETSIVVGREQESDTELKETISRGIPIQGSDDSCSRALLQLRMVNSVFVQTNPYKDTRTFLGVEIESRQRYVALRVSNPLLSIEEADLISKAILDTSIFKANYQRPKDNKVKYYFGISEDNLTKSEDEGGAGLDGTDENSNCVLVRNTLNYGNYADVYFYLAKPTEIDVRIAIRYFGNYTNSEKENMLGEIKKLTARAVAELAQVGASLLSSQIIARLMAKTDLNDKIEIRSMLLNLHDNPKTTQSLDAKSYEYFSVYDVPSRPYAGVIVTEDN